MEKIPIPSQENKTEQESAYFKNYEIGKTDIETLQYGIDILIQSKLVEEETLMDLRLVTYDSKNFYVLTRGVHASNERFTVEEIPFSNKTGFRIYKIPHSGFTGKSEEDYHGARAWFLHDAIETTAINARKFPNENVLYQPDLPQPNEILDVIAIPPFEPYDKIQQGRFNYLTDVIFHEVGHIEFRRLRNWQQGEKIINVFPSDQKKEKFLSTIKQTKIFPKQITNLIVNNISENAIREMYPMLIDREAAKRYDVQKFDRENREFQKVLDDLKNESINYELVQLFKKSLEDGHFTGRLLVRILEEKFPDFVERKRFVRSALERIPTNKEN